MRLFQSLLMAIASVCCGLSLHGHVDKTSIEIVGAGKTDTFTILDRSGCAATTESSIQDTAIGANSALQTASEIIGPWTDVSGATSPFSVPLNRPQAFTA